jgi:hypothetical protein
MKKYKYNSNIKYLKKNRNCKLIYFDNYIILKVKLYKKI